ncbi:MAG TPA: thiamine-phosphate kinase, partial [Labilithrix sp.]|nr:thiamine-phosphate kinase [Labilithrix sp.]
LQQGRAMAQVASAALDVSDGLSRDAMHLAEASGVLLVFDEIALRARAHGALETAAALVGRDALALAMSGGEDYALLATSPTDIVGFDRVGTVEQGPAGVTLLRVDGVKVPVDPQGFDHFA